MVCSKIYKTWSSGLLLVLLLLSAARIFAQKVNMSKNNTLTIGCYSANQMEVAEEFCLFENHRFILSAMARWTSLQKAPGNRSTIRFI
ncbi:hypothetical protein [Chitinophaga sp. RAB17]|uniref:hypothetical protein n=1 Tax=Chitinophaga sp. RAB17 TaxID=3233049 RepID=UPI003F9291D1